MESRMYAEELGLGVCKSHSYDPTQGTSRALLPVGLVPYGNWGTEKAQDVQRFPRWPLPIV